MKQISLRLIIAITTFIVGITSATIWISKHRLSTQTPRPPADCAPAYDPSVLAKHIREDNDPQLFAAFREPLLYAMPDCVDESYRLIWIPSFHSPVMVRVWRSGNSSFIAAKQLDSKGWSKLGILKDENTRPLTEYEWHYFVSLLNRTSYWEMPSTTDEPLINDGAVWIVEGLRDKQYHWVRRRLPSDQYAEICKRLIELSGLETAHSLYLPQSSSR